MKQKYSDLLKFGTPLWYDDNGTPRFEEFNPELLPDIYIDRAYYGTCICQRCHKEFKVGFGVSCFSRFTIYGDPPIHDCVGDAMTSAFIVEQVYKKIKGEWHCMIK